MCGSDSKAELHFWANAHHGCQGGQDTSCKEPKALGGLLVAALLTWPITTQLPSEPALLLGEGAWATLPLVYWQALFQLPDYFSASSLSPSSTCFLSPLLSSNNCLNNAALLPTYPLRNQKPVEPSPHQSALTGSLWSGSTPS